MAQMSVEEFAEIDMEGFLGLSQLEYGPSPSTNPDHIRWKHLDSPYGPSSYISLIETDQLVGRALIQPRPLYTETETINVASVMDLLIDREHRLTPMNFINITEACGNLASYDMVFHTSNARTFPLYSKLLKFPNPFSLRAYGFPVRLAGAFTSVFGRRIGAIDWFTAPLRWIIEFIAYAVNAVARLDISQREMNENELEVICAKCLRQSGPHLARTKDFLKWRFIEAPLWPASIWRIDRKGQFIGYFVTRKVEMDGLVHFVLMDFILDPETPLIAQLALRLWLIRKAITSHADVLFTMVNASSSIARKCVGFPLIRIPDKLLPHTTPIFMRARNRYTKEFESNQLIHMTLADLDYF